MFSVTRCFECLEFRDREQKLLSKHYQGFLLIVIYDYFTYVYESSLH